MAKSIKFKNSVYLDSQSIIHKMGESRDSVSNILNQFLKYGMIYRGHYQGKDTCFNQYDKNGIYTFSGYTGEYINNPLIGNEYGIIFQFCSTIYGVQFIVSPSRGKLWMRTHIESKKWGTWFEIR